MYMVIQTSFDSNVDACNINFWKPNGREQNDFLDSEPQVLAIDDSSPILVKNRKLQIWSTGVAQWWLWVWLAIHWWA